MGKITEVPGSEKITLKDAQGNPVGEAEPIKHETRLDELRHKFVNAIGGRGNIEYGEFIELMKIETATPLPEIRITKEAERRDNMLYWTVGENSPAYYYLQTKENGKWVDVPITDLRPVEEPKPKRKFNIFNPKTW